MGDRAEKRKQDAQARLYEANQKKLKKATAALDKAESDIIALDLTEDETDLRKNLHDQIKRIRDLTTEKGEVLNAEKEDSSMASSSDILQLVETSLIRMETSNKQTSQQIVELSSKMENKTTDSYVWNNEGNRKPFEINNNALAKLHKVKFSAQQGQLDQALQFLQEGIVVLQERNKCIRIADSSPSGWNTVNEYLSSPVADNEDDDKRIKRAEKLALEKYQSRILPKKFANFRPRNGNFYPRQPYVPRFEGPRFSRPPMPNADQSYRMYGSFKSQHPVCLPSVVQDNTYGYNDRKSSITCYNCKQLGHYANEYNVQKGEFTQ